MTRILLALLSATIFFAGLWWFISAWVFLASWQPIGATVALFAGLILIVAGAFGLKAVYEGG